MSASTLLIAALLLLALGVGLLGIAGLWLSGQQQRTAATLQGALRSREPRAPAESGTPPPVAAAPRGWAWLATLGERFNGGRIEAALLAPEDRLLLDQAGLLLAAMVYEGDGLSRVVAMGAALGAGVLLPKFALRAWATRLRRRVSAELPLLIDLLRLLQGVGFSMDQSLQTLGDKLRSAIPVLGREIQQANIAYMHGRSRQQSLRRLAESFGDEDLRSLVQLMLQVHEHGGAVQEPLRQFSVRLREQRRSALKEKVGKLSVKMTIVMMLTLLPALMLVLSGPAIIALANAVNRLG